MEKQNLFSKIRHLRPKFSSWGVREEKIINFHDLVEKRFSILQQEVKGKNIFHFGGKTAFKCPTRE